MPRPEVAEPVWILLSKLHGWTSTSLKNTCVLVEVKEVGLGDHLFFSALGFNQYPRELEKSSLSFSTRKKVSQNINSQ